LLDAHGIRVQPKRAARIVAAQSMSARLNERLRRFACLVQDDGRVHHFLLEPNLPGGDAGDVEQVIDQTPELPGLPFHHVHRPCLFRRVRAALEQAGRAGHRSERIAQLMREHGEEFVLAAIDLPCLRHERADLVLAAAGAQCHFATAHQRIRVYGPLDDGNIS
jgi:hypothetical protein